MTFGSPPPAHCESLVFSDSIVLEPIEAVVTQPSQAELSLTVEVVMSNMATALYQLAVPMDSTLLEALQILQNTNVGFT